MHIMNEQKLAFLRDEYIPLLQRLEVNSAGSWGKMNAQQMVEHVSDFFKVSTEKIKLPLVTPEEQLPKFKAFLLSDKEFRENTRAPVDIVPEEPQPVRSASLQTAIAELQNEINDFTVYFQQHPGNQTQHPTFGSLHYEEWVLLHYKHVMHHSKQFGLM